MSSSLQDWVSPQTDPSTLTPSSTMLPTPADVKNCGHFNYSESPYPALQSVQQSYRQAHPYVAIVLCTYGVITNIINILVLTKPNMRNSINCILTGIAVADIITMLSCIPLMYHYYLRPASDNQYEFGWTIFVAVHMNLTMTSHTSSLWLGVIMAAMRYFFVRPTTRGAQTLDCRSTLVVVLITFIAGILIVLPNVIVTGVELCVSNGTMEWHLKPPTFGQNSNSLHTVTFFVYPIAGKIVPCILISIFGGLLLHTLRETDQRSRRLRGASKQGSNGNGNSGQTRRTTIMLLAIIALYIISELPQSILLLLCIFVDNFFVEIYSLLGDFVDLLSLINSAMNFITYIAMSSQYRATLIQMSCACVHAITCHKCGKLNALQSTKYSKAPPTAV